MLKCTKLLRKTAIYKLVPLTFTLPTYMRDQKNQFVQSMVILGILYFILGFVTWLNGPLITFVKLAFGLDTDSKAFWVTTAFYMAYFFLALPSSWILEKTGMKKGMAFGLIVTAVGSFVFGTYATERNYAISLVGLFIIGSGLSVLQTAVNPYVSIIGPIESGAQRISIMGICNKVAGMISPIVIGTFVLAGIDKLEEQVKMVSDGQEKEAILTEFASKIYVPYIVMAAVLVLTALWIMKSPLPELKASEVNAEPVGRSKGNRTSLFQFPHLWLGALCLFVYVGAEVMAGDAITTYANGFNIPKDETKYFTSLTLGSMLLGYLLGLITIPKFISQQVALRISAVLGILFALGALFTTGYVSVGFVAALGLANAAMWPAIFPLAISGLGKFTEKGSAILVMGIAGGAIIPKIFASMKEEYSFQWVFFILMFLCYLYILFYSMKGHKVGQS